MKSASRQPIELTIKLETLIENFSVVFEQSPLAIMLASEDVLLSEEEDYAWAHL
jgi:hypothetical protein